MFVSVQLLSRVRLFVTPWTAARQASLSITNCGSPPKPMSIESMMPSSHLILCRPFLLLPSIFPRITVFSNESAVHIRWPKYWSFSFNISPSNEHSGLISFRVDWLDLLAVQGTLMSLLQHHSSKASILRRSAFFIVQLSHPYMTTGKTVCISLNQLRILFKISKFPPSVLTYFNISIGFHVWRNSECFILVLLLCLLTVSQYCSGISFHCHRRSSFCFSPVVEFLFFYIPFRHLPWFTYSFWRSSPPVMSWERIQR